MSMSHVFVDIRDPIKACVALLNVRNAHITLLNLMVGSHRDLGGSSIVQRHLVGRPVVE